MLAWCSATEVRHWLEGQLLMCEHARRRRGGDEAPELHSVSVKESLTPLIIRQSQTRRTSVGDAVEGYPCTSRTGNGSNGVGGTKGLHHY